ncbi:hypothetical protein AT15_07865 [Kosmotoga arenicorallina S304]|uniref:Putative Se/S carrier protein-like domain-containing protein n=1 Tax=Kosmotoga arenicorallina S304 TaxID=1453497 RepID=A0A176K381_9BACT|nr:putative Se/S carrier-like protein [Kosmotoga arenicorallina]OAA31403.1 hypothetical protein AT15_07865 [Kosmotoga arenicorallina S304]
MCDTLVLNGLLIVAQKDARKALEILRKAHFFVKLFPTPPAAFAGCSISLALNSENLKTAREKLESLGVRVLKSLYLDKNIIGEFYEHPGY